MSKTEARGIRNKNPGNIRWSKDEWRGLLVKAQRTDSAFCQFSDAKLGIRALLIILFNYRNKAGLPGVGGKGIDTIREIITRWAPPEENDTPAYIASVCAQAGLKPEQPVDLNNIVVARDILKAIITHENGTNPYPDTLIDAAIKLAYDSRL